MLNGKNIFTITLTIALIFLISMAGFAQNNDDLTELDNEIRVKIENYLDISMEEKEELKINIQELIKQQKINVQDLKNFIQKENPTGQEIKEMVQLMKQYVAQNGEAKELGEMLREKNRYQIREEIREHLGEDMDDDDDIDDIDDDEGYNDDEDDNGNQYGQNNDDDDDVDDDDMDDIDDDNEEDDD